MAPLCPGPHRWAEASQRQLGCDSQAVLCQGRGGTALLFTPSTKSGSGFKPQLIVRAGCYCIS